MTATSDPDMIFWTTEDGEPWALFAWGDVPAALMPLEGAAAHLSFQGGYDKDIAVEMLTAAVGPVARWIWQNKDADDDDGYHYQWCEEGHPKAVRITGWRF